MRERVVWSMPATASKTCNSNDGNGQTLKADLVKMVAGRLSSPRVRKRWRRKIGRLVFAEQQQRTEVALLDLHGRGAVLHRETFLGRFDDDVRRFGIVGVRLPTVLWLERERRRPVLI